MRLSQAQNLMRKFLVLLANFILLSGCLHRPQVFYFGDYSEAEALYHHGEYERSIQKYQAYIDENPEGHLAVISQYYIGRSHAALGHTEAAKEIFQDIIRDHPNVVWANFADTQLKEIEAKNSASAPPPQ